MKNVNTMSEMEAILFEVFYETGATVPFTISGSTNEFVLVRINEDGDIVVDIRDTETRASVLDQEETFSTASEAGGFICYWTGLAY